MLEPTFTSRLASRDYPKERFALMFQQWRHLLFLHWEYDKAALQKTLPNGLFVDTFKEKAYIGIAPFWMQNIHLPGVPPIPGTSHFFELNLRTYVFDEAGTPGVWFYSLDANHFLAVQAARFFFSLPYRYAQIQAELKSPTEIIYECQPNGFKHRLKYRYNPNSATTQLAQPESLEFFLLERYILFAQRKGKLFKGQVHHAPYRFCYPDVWEWDAELFAMSGLIAPQQPPVHRVYCPGVDVAIFGLQQVGT